MKNMLLVLGLIFIPSTAFALIGFGIQAGSDLSKLGPETYVDNSGVTPVVFNSYEMKNSPVGGGAYAFVDLFGFALEGDFDFAVGEYEFDFGNEYITLDPVQFAWGRFSYATTLKKNIMDISIPFLAKAAINAGGGFGGHISTPRASIDMVKELFGDNLVAFGNPSEEDAKTAEDLERELITYLEDNSIEASGLHLQAGLRFKVLVLDTHLNARYNLAKNVYDGKNGFLQLMFKIGFAI
tara:strand:- start:61 stop:777 length:717 start_codon:yes stop_codon:yes gene_type:complete